MQGLSIAGRKKTGKSTKKKGRTEGQKGVRSTEKTPKAGGESRKLGGETHSRKRGRATWSYGQGEKPEQLNRAKEGSRGELVKYHGTL